MNLGEFLMYQRKRQNIQLKELAEKAEISVTTIQNYEKNKKNSTIYNIDKLLDALNTDLVIGVNSDLRNL